MEEKLHYNAHYQLTYLRQETPERQLYGPPRRQRQRQLPAAMATASLSKYVASWCYSSHGIINFTYNWRFQLYQNWLNGDDQLCVGGQQQPSAISLQRLRAGAPQRYYFCSLWLTLFSFWFQLIADNDLQVSLCASLIIWGHSVLAACWTLVRVWWHFFFGISFRFLAKCCCVFWFYCHM